ncbi:MAG: hypothetical protein R3C11_20195 [Planctomycetaceae bacterium]
MFNLLLRCFRVFSNPRTDQPPSIPDDYLTHWEYSFGLHTCNLGDTVREGVNPFTGERVGFPIDNGLTEVEMDTVQEVFERYSIIGPEPDGEGYAVYGKAGESIRFRGGELHGKYPLVGLSVEITTVLEVTEEVAGIVLEVAGW